MVTFIRFCTTCIFLIMFTYVFYNLHKATLRDDINLLDKYTNLGFIVSLMFIVFLTLLPLPTYIYHSVEFNLIPFSTIIGMLGDPYIDIVDTVFNLLGNMILFVPIGFFVYIKFDGNFNKSFLFCMLTTLSVEIIQLLIPSRFSDIDDFILNLLGGLIGIIISRAFTILFTQSKLKKDSI